MKTSLLFFSFIFLVKISSSQVTIHPACDTSLPLARSVSVFIKTHPQEKQVGQDFFKNDFELAASDSSFKIAFSRFSWNDSNTIIQRKNNGNIVRVDMPNYNKPDKENFSLRNIKPGAYLVFECIQVEKNGIVYRVPPFTVIVKRE
jgi:hypothetical protein